MRRHGVTFGVRRGSLNRIIKRVACGVSRSCGVWRVRVSRIRSLVASAVSRLRCEETKLPSFGGVWSAGPRVASGLTRVACGVTVCGAATRDGHGAGILWRASVAIGVWRVACGVDH